MGAGFSQVSRCFNPASPPDSSETDAICTENAPLDETLGHSFCYVRSSARFVSPTHSDRFVSPSQSLRFDDTAQQKPVSKQAGYPETGFRAISGASVSANSSTPMTVLQQDDIFGDATDAPNHQIAASSSGCKGFTAGIPKCGGNNVMLDGFESTSSFTALPLQRLPRGMEMQSGPQERTFFMSGPIERGAFSGLLDVTAASDNSGGVPFSAPLGGMYSKKRRKKKNISAIRKALYRNFSVMPVRNFISGRRKDTPPGGDSCKEAPDMDSESNVQWALGKAGEDRVHVVISEELGWLFVGIYDGFNGPDAPEFLMSHLYKAVHSELEGLFWDTTDTVVASESIDVAQNSYPSNADAVDHHELRERQEGVVESQLVKKVMFEGQQLEIRRRRLWELLVEDHPEDGLDLSGSERFAFSVADALSVNGAGSAVSRSSLLLSKLKHGLLSRHRVKDTSRLFPWRFWLEGKQKAMEENREGYVADDGDIGNERLNRFDRKRKVGLVNHELVLGAMARALDMTEKAYLDLTDRVLDRYPELALMGSCLLAVLMRDEDVYVMNVGDSRAIVAQLEPPEVSCLKEESVNPESDEFDGEGIVEESAGASGKEDESVNEANAHQSMSLTALQLSTDHSTSIEEEILRIQNEHPDDRNCIVNGRVKGRLKVTRAFGAGFLKQCFYLVKLLELNISNDAMHTGSQRKRSLCIITRRRWNDTLLEMFRNDYIGTAPYISCAPSLHHHKLDSRDQFLVLSSDGLYQYFSNQEVVSHVRHFMERFPDGDPAQHLIEELLFRAAKKAGMDFHELLDIPQGDRRKYHDDVTVMVVSLEGRIWKSSGKYV